MVKILYGEDFVWPYENHRDGKSSGLCQWGREAAKWGELHNANSVQFFGVYYSTGT